MNNKHNWKLLKRDFLKGDYLNLKDFAKAKKISYQVVRRRATNWLQISNKIEQKAEEKFIESEAQKHAREMKEANERQKRIAVALQLESEKKIKQGKIGSNPAISAKIGQDMERTALGMENEIIKNEVTDTRLDEETLKHLKIIGDDIVKRRYSRKDKSKHTQS